MNNGAIKDQIQREELMRKFQFLTMVSCGILSMVVFLAAHTAVAQKAKDTLRIGLREQVGLMSLIYNARPETGLFEREVVDTLLSYNPNTGKYEGLLGESWKQINPTTLEVKLKKGIKFHDGSEFDADDVVYTLNWAADPKVRFRFKSSYNWVKVVEKIDKYNVRIISKKAFGPALARLGVTIAIYPSDVHNKLKVKSDFGKHPIGTGRYKVVSIDRSTGIKLVKNPDYNHGNAAKPAATIGTIIGVPIPDMQTQMAQLMVGGIDLIHGVPKSLADEMLKDPRFEISSTTGINYFYMALDSVGRSKVNALKNIKVREALMRAIDRKLIIKAVVPGGNPDKHVIPALCLRIQVGCDYSSQPPAFDRDKAKALLAETGYAKGFDVTINSFPGAFDVAEAVGGELRKIGVRAKIQKLSFGAYRKAQKQGKQSILVAHWSSGGLPDASSTMNYWFSKTGRDFWRDDIVDGLRKQGDSTIDVAKRREIYKQAYDRVNDQRWILPLSLRPGIFVHTKEIAMDEVVISPIGFKLGGIRWK